MKHPASYLIAGCLAILLAVAAHAQAGGESPQELRRQLDGLRTQMAEQMKQMNAVQARLDELERAKVAAPTTTTAAQEQQPPVPPVPPSVPTQHVSEATTNYQTFAADQEAAARINNAPLDP